MRGTGRDCSCFQRSRLTDLRCVGDRWRSDDACRARSHRLCLEHTSRGNCARGVARQLNMNEGASMLELGRDKTALASNYMWRCSVQLARGALACVAHASVHCRISGGQREIGRETMATDISKMPHRASLRIARD
ncbi:unnamed protein product [Rangifer tarandus platyrhynchus]|uniref:Uncharacterized protein n=1 Tax=Rangifer tarandus platyrhynchus TaxID=3082113 RepID=A0ABN8XJD9_RANTA|nr:unnamed protein product [Rangifer tarandus platyrhynchus]